MLVDASKRGNSAVLKWAKVPTSADVKTGVEHVIKALLTECLVSTADVKCVTIGTTVSSRHAGSAWHIARY